MKNQPRIKQTELAGSLEFGRYTAGAELTPEESIRGFCYTCMFNFSSRFDELSPECANDEECPLYPYSPFQEGNIKVDPRDRRDYIIINP